MKNLIGHCQVCARPIKVVRGLIARHGYYRIGRVENGKTCLGTRQPPLEVSFFETDITISAFEDLIAQIQKVLAQAQNGNAHPIEVSNSINVRQKVKWEDATEWDREKGQKLFIAGMMRDIADLVKQVDMLREAKKKYHGKGLIHEANIQ